MSVSRMYRVLQMITMLQSGRGYTADELARELEVSRRTIFRDLNVLEMARIPYYFDQQSQCYRIDKNFFLPPVNLTLSEALAMLILTGRLGGETNLPLLSQSARAAVKLESALPSSIRAHVGSVMQRLSFSLGPTSRHDDLEPTFEQLTAAISKKQVCRLVYISFLERKQLRLDVHPLRLLFQSRAWYLIAYSCLHKEIRTFKLGRIRSLTLTGRTFASSPSVDPAEHFDGAWSMIPEGKFHDVHLRFEPKVAGNVAEVAWHRSQRVTWRDDGSIDFHVRVNGLGEIGWWILGYGDQVEVHSPPELRRHVRKVAESMATRYSQPSRLGSAKEAN
jgi:predicted DNA-binding transcriptional regulator YafY